MTRCDERMSGGRWAAPAATWSRRRCVYACGAQDAVEPEVAANPVTADAATEGYLGRLGLKELLADHSAGGSSRRRGGAEDDRRAAGEDM
jgi:hypothetical protein